MCLKEYGHVRKHRHSARTLTNPSLTYSPNNQQNYGNTVDEGHVHQQKLQRMLRPQKPELVFEELSQCIFFANFSGTTIAVVTKSLVQQMPQN